MTRLSRAMVGMLAALALGACSDDSGNTTPVDTGPGGDGPSGLSITITAPAAGATDVSVSAPELKASLSQALDKPDDLRAVLVQDGTELQGLVKYSATNLEVIFSPFNLMRSRTQYTFEVTGDGVTASVDFTTAAANEGPLPPVAGKTYDFRIKTISHPADLADLFNSQLKTAPPVVMHVVDVVDVGEKDGNKHGTFNMVGSVGLPEDPVGQAKVPAEDVDHPTTTSMAMDGQMEGQWFGVGPSDLHLTASGIPLVIRDFFATGVMDTDGTKLGEVGLTGLIDPKELGEALGGLDLSFICNDKRFKKYCDEDGRIRVAATIETAANPIPFTAFLTKPVNAAKEVDPATTVEGFCSEELDPAGTTLTLTDGSGSDVPGQLTVTAKGFTFTPDAPLAAATEYTVALTATAKSGGATDTRHLTFTTK